VNKKVNLTFITVLTFAIVVVGGSIFAAAATVIIIIPNNFLKPADAVDWGDPADPRTGRTGQAPSVVTGDNVYVAWWNGTAGEPDIQTDVMFRASTDGGATFGDRINLSNSSDADSWRVEIAGEGETVVVSWWETNQTSDTPVARVSNDAGETFGPMIMLGTNGTISGTEGEGEGGQETVEEAVEEAAAGEGGG
jgi:hypothetical protein